MSQTDRVRGGLTLAALDTPEADSNRGWVQLMRTTDGVAKNGSQKFEITPDDLQAYAESIKASPGRIPIDYDHSYAEGQGTRAAGWVASDTAEIRGNELWAQVDWTPAAADAIRNGEFRYISPEFSFASSKDGVLKKAKAFLASALTNRPFFADMAPVTLIDSTEVTMSDALVATLKKNLGLPEGADEAAVSAALAAKDEEIASLTAKTAELAKRPAIAEDQLQTLLASAAKGEQASKDLHDMKREQVLTAAIAAGKILPAQKDGFATMFDLDAENVVKLLDATPEKSFKPVGSNGEGEPETPAVALKGVQEGEVLILADEAAKVTANLAERNIAPDKATPEQYLESVAIVRAKA